MPKSVLRIVAVLLVPCLIGDPTLAAVSPLPVVSHVSCCSNLFTEQAFNPPAGAYSRSPINRHASIVLLGLAAAAAWSLGHIATQTAHPVLLLAGAPLIFGISRLLQPLFAPFFDRPSHSDEPVPPAATSAFITKVDLSDKEERMNGLYHFGLFFLGKFWDNLLASMNPKAALDYLKDIDRIIAGPSPGVSTAFNYRELADWDLRIRAMSYYIYGEALDEEELMLRLKSADTLETYLLENADIAFLALFDLALKKEGRFTFSELLTEFHEEQNRVHRRQKGRHSFASPGFDEVLLQRVLIIALNKIPAPPNNPGGPHILSLLLPLFLSGALAGVGQPHGMTASATLSGLSLLGTLTHQGFPRFFAPADRGGAGGVGEWPSDEEAMRAAWSRRDQTPAYRRAETTALGQALRQLRREPWPAAKTMEELNRRTDDLVSGLKAWLGSEVDMQRPSTKVERFKITIHRALTWDEWVFLLDLNQFGTGGLHLVNDPLWSVPISPEQASWFFQFAEAVDIQLPYVWRAGWVDRIAQAGRPLVLGHRRYAISVPRADHTARYSGNNPSYLASDLDSGQDILIKIADPRETSHFRDLQRLGLPHLPEAIDENRAHPNALILKVVKGDNVGYLFEQLNLKKGIWDPGAVGAKVALWLKAAEALQDWHDRGISKNDVNSGDFVLRYADQDIVMVDFDAPHGQYLARDVQHMADLLVSGVVGMDGIDGPDVPRVLAAFREGILSVTHDPGAAHRLLGMLPKLLSLEETSIRLDELMAAVRDLKLADPAALNEFLDSSMRAIQMQTIQTDRQIMSTSQKYGNKTGLTPDVDYIERDSMLNALSEALAIVAPNRSVPEHLQGARVGLLGVRELHEITDLLNRFPGIADLHLINAREANLGHLEKLLRRAQIHSENRKGQGWPKIYGHQVNAMELPADLRDLDVVMQSGLLDPAYVDEGQIRQIESEVIRVLKTGGLHIVGDELWARRWLRNANMGMTPIDISPSYLVHAEMKVAIFIGALSALWGVMHAFSGTAGIPHQMTASATVLGVSLLGTLAHQGFQRFFAPADADGRGPGPVLTLWPTILRGVTAGGRYVEGSDAVMVVGEWRPEGAVDGAAVVQDLRQSLARLRSDIPWKISAGDYFVNVALNGKAQAMKRMLKEPALINKKFVLILGDSISSDFLKAEDLREDEPFPKPFAQILVQADTTPGLSDLPHAKAIGKGVPFTETFLRQLVHEVQGHHDLLDFLHQEGLAVPTDLTHLSAEDIVIIADIDNTLLAGSDSLIEGDDKQIFRPALETLLVQLAQAGVSWRFLSGKTIEEVTGGRPRNDLERFFLPLAHAFSRARIPLHRVAYYGAQGLQDVFVNDRGEAVYHRAELKDGVKPLTAEETEQARLLIESTILQHQKSVDLATPARRPDFVDMSKIVEGWIDRFDPIWTSIGAEWRQEHKRGVKGLLSTAWKDLVLKIIFQRQPGYFREGALFERLLERFNGKLWISPPHERIPTREGLFQFLAREGLPQADQETQDRQIRAQGAYFILMHLSYLALDILESGSAQAEAEFQHIQYLLDKLNDRLRGNMPVLVQDVSFLTLLSLSQPSRSEMDILKLWRNTDRLVTPARKLQIHSTDAQLVGAHLRATLYDKERSHIDWPFSQIRPADAMDYPALVADLEIVLRDYQQAVRAGDAKRRKRLAGVFLGGMSGDPILIPVSPGEESTLKDLFFTSRYVSEPNLPEYGDLKKYYEARKTEYIRLLRESAPYLADDIQAFAPDQVAFSPLVPAEEFSLEYVKTLALANHRDGHPNFTVEQMYRSGDDKRAYQVFGDEEFAQRLAFARRVFSETLERLEKLAAQNPIPTKNKNGLAKGFLALILLKAGLTFIPHHPDSRHLATAA